MTVSIRHMAPVAHWPLVLGVLRKLAVAQLMDTLSPPHPADVLSSGRGGEARVWAILDGHHALYKVGRRLDERGMFPLWQPGLERPAVHDTRLGQMLEALVAAHLKRVFGALALTALKTYAMGTPWMPQDTPTIALSGAYDREPDDTTAPRPSSGHSQDGRGERKHVLLSLGVSGDGGLPLRLGLQDGKTRESSDVPRASAESLARGRDGVKGSVAESQASSQRPWGWCLAQQRGWVTLVPRTGAMRQAVEAWGRQQSSLPFWVDTPGRTRQEPPRRWYGRSVSREVEGE